MDVRKHSNRAAWTSDTRGVHIYSRNSDRGRWVLVLTMPWSLHRDAIAGDAICAMCAAVTQ